LARFTPSSSATQVSALAMTSICSASAPRELRAVGRQHQRHDDRDTEAGGRPDPRPVCG
jgi:hypothetical protein